MLPLAASGRNAYVITSVVCLLVVCVCHKIPKKDVKEISLNASSVDEGNIIPCKNFLDCTKKDANMICNSMNECICLFNERIQFANHGSVCSDGSSRVGVRCKNFLDCPYMSKMECIFGNCVCQPNIYDTTYLLNGRMLCVDKPSTLPLPKECYKDSECYNKDPGKFCSSDGNCICHDQRYIKSLGSYAKTDCPRGRRDENLDFRHLR